MTSSPSNNTHERESLNSRPRFELSSQPFKLAGRLDQVSGTAPQPSSRVCILSLVYPNLLAHAGLHQPNRRATA